MKESLQEQIEAFLKAKGQWREGTNRTPERVVKAWEEFSSGLEEDPNRHVVLFDTAADGVNYDEVIIISDIEFSSICEHHFLPFFGYVHVGYLPDNYIIGASKIPRIVNCFAKRPQVQERMTGQIADFLYNCALKPKGVIVVVEAVHTCMKCRGAKSTGSMITSAVRGCFIQYPIKQEFFELLKIRKGVLK